MSTPEVTIVVVQRERFSQTERALESVYEHTNIPFNLIYIDGKSPAKLKRYLQEQSQAKGFHLIRKERFVPTNEGRNLALSLVKTKYVAFIENDLIVAPGWLENLIQCAEETGAWAVGPLYCESEPVHQRIHMAGGEAHVLEKKGKRYFHEHHRMRGQKVAEMLPQLQRQPIELIEFHCALMRTDKLKEIGGFDEGIKTAPSHIDFCLTVRDRGGEIYFDPSAIVTYITPPPLTLADIPFFNYRWSDRLNRQSLEHFRKKWNLADDDPFINRHYRWMARHRQIILKPIEEKIAQVFPWGLGFAKWVYEKIVFPSEAFLNRLLVRAADKPSSH